MGRRKANYFSLAIIMIVLLLTLLAIPAQGEEWAVGETKEVDIGNGPENSEFPNYLFNISNLKPGDTATRTLAVSNNGLRDFSYSAKIKNVSGDEEFLNTLRLEVTDGNVTFYDGPVGTSESQLFAQRPLSVDSGETLQFLVVFPNTEENQNHLQGDEAQFVLELVAEDYMQTNFGFKKITGGGTVEHTGNSGGSEGFNVMPTSEGLRVMLNYIEHDKSSSIKKIKVNQELAYNTREITENGKVIGIEFDVMGVVNNAESVRLHVIMVDHGEPGNQDLFNVKIIEGYNSGHDVITGGNVQIHY